MLIPPSGVNINAEMRKLRRSIALKTLVSM